MLIHLTPWISTFHQKVARKSWTPTFFVQLSIDKAGRLTQKSWGGSSFSFSCMNFSFFYSLPHQMFATMLTFVGVPWSCVEFSFIMLCPLSILVSKSASIVNTDVCIQQTYRTQHIFLSPDLNYKSDRTLNFPIIIKFQSPLGLLGCHNEMSKLFVNSEFKFHYRNFSSSH